MSSNAMALYDHIAIIGSLAYLIAERLFDSWGDDDE